MDNRIDWRIWTAIAGAILAGFGSGSISRVDPFTGADAAIIEQRLEAKIQGLRSECSLSTQELHTKINVLLSELPAAATKERIVELENMAREHHKYKPPTYKWK